MKIRLPIRDLPYKRHGFAMLLKAALWTLFLYLFTFNHRKHVSVLLLKCSPGRNMFLGVCCSFAGFCNVFATANEHNTETRCDHTKVLHRLQRLASMGITIVITTSTASLEILLSIFPLPNFISRTNSINPSRIFDAVMRHRMTNENWLMITYPKLIHLVLSIISGWLTIELWKKKMSDLCY